MANLGKVAQGDRRTVTLTVGSNGQAVNITGATITGWKQSTRTGTAYNITGTLAVSDGPAGRFTWARSEGDTGQAGSWRVYFKLVIGGTPYRTLPAAWEVVNSPDFEIVPSDPLILVGVTTDEAALLAAFYDGFDAALDGDGPVKSGAGLAWLAGGGAGIPPISPAVAGNFVTQLANGSLEDAGVAPGSFDASGAAAAAGAAVQGNLDTHTGDASIHFEQGDISINPNQAGADPAGSAAERVPKLADITAARTAGYTLQVSDLAAIIPVSGTFTLSLPDGLATGFQALLVRTGAGTVTLAAATTLVSDGTQLSEDGAAATVLHLGSDIWYAFGKLT